MEEPGAAAADALISGASDVQVMSSDPGARAPDGMAAEGGAVARNNDEPNDASFYLHVFELYETQSNFYMIRKNRSRTSWRLLKIGRLRASELNICQESTTYTESECKELLNRIHEENKSTGGLKFVTDCYGIVGFVKFLGPYYMLLITEREEIGAILGHTIYAITKSKIIALPNSSVQSNMANSREERRYKKLFCTVDITQGFFFSYSYSIMQSLQKNMCEGKTGQMLYESMFIWNEFLTREIHSRLKSTLWTVYLVYGFFKQVKLSTHGKDFWLTLIARRSQHCAGTRYLKRGVDEDGNVANDVETEQIIFEDIPGEIPTCFSSIVQNRGSIPLFWSQETSKLNLKPDIILNKDKGYEATKLHFDNLAERYGKPIVILNLIKSEEKKPRESILRSEFASAVKYVDKNLSEDSHLKFLHWDLHKHYRSKAKNVLTMLVEVAACTLMLTDFFYCEMAPALRYESDLRWPTSVMDDAGDQSSNNICSSSSCSTTDKDDVDMQENGSQENMDSDISGSETKTIVVSNGGLCSVKSLRCQKGVLRTNCIDCLDRTNIAQYAYGLVALGHQLHALKLSPCPSIPLDATLANHLMTYYEKMGDKLSLQYGGSTAHNKIFSERRGQCKATIRYQELLRTFQRYYSNAFTDVDKQAAIDLFLGQFQPQLDKPAIWEDCGVGKSGHGFTNEISRSFIRRSLSDGNILHEIYTLLSSCSFSQNAPSSSKSSQVGYSILPYPIYRYTAVVPHGQHFAESADSYLYKDWYSNFLDFESILSSQSFLEGEMNDRSTSNSPIESPSTQNIADGRSNEASSDLVENGSITEGDQVIEEQPHDTVRTANKRNKFPDSFAHWVHHGEALYR